MNRRHTMKRLFSLLLALCLLSGAVSALAAEEAEGDKVKALLDAMTTEESVFIRAG